MAMTREQGQEAAKRARTTATMAKTLANALAKIHGRRLNFVEFLGPKKSESRGIVDILAIRKDGKVPSIIGLKSLDLFDMILIQVKGGSARSPSVDDIARMKLVAAHYHATQVILFEWTKAKHTGWSRLSADDHWEPVTASSIFGN